MQPCSFKSRCQQPCFHVLCPMHTRGDFTKVFCLHSLERQPLWPMTLWGSVDPKSGADNEMAPKCGEWSLQCEVALGSIGASVPSFETALLLPSVTSWPLFLPLHSIFRKTQNLGLWKEMISESPSGSFFHCLGE